MNKVLSEFSNFRFQALIQVLLG